MILEHPLLKNFPKLDTSDNSASITKVIDFLRRDFPDLQINGLMSDLWDLFLHRQIWALQFDGIPSMAATAVLHKSEKISFPILVPPAWSANAMVQPVMACGSIVFCGSQAVDFFNGRLLGPDRALIPEAMSRSYAFESTFLLHFERSGVEWGPNPYQKGVLERFPEGISSPLLYDRKPVVVLH